MGEKESLIELIWQNPVLDEGFTAIPNVLLRKAGELGITDREFHFIVQLASFKYSSESEIKPSYRTLAKRMGKHHINLRKTAAALEKKKMLTRIIRKSEEGDFETVVFDLSPLLGKLFPSKKEEGGISEIANTPHSEIANTGTSEIANRIIRNSKKTNSEEENNEIASPIFKELKEKGLSKSQIKLISITRPNLSLKDIQDTWKWVGKTSHFKNKEATFYTALIENWTNPNRHR